MNKEQTAKVLEIVERFQDRTALLTNELKAEMLEAGINATNPEMLEVSAAQELVLAASKQMAKSVQKTLLSSSEAKNPKAIISAISTITEMAEHIMRTSVIDELEKGGVDVESAENYLMEKIRQAFLTAKKPEQPTKPVMVKNPDDDDPTVH